MKASDMIERMIVAILIGFAMYVGLLALYLIAFVQIMSLPFARDRKPDPNGMRVGKSLSAWLFEASRYLCFATDEKPFPWKAWPRAD